MGQVFEIINSPNVHRVRRAQYQANKKLRAANNTREAAFTALQEFSRTLGNQMMMEGAGKEYNAAVADLGAALDARTLGKANIAMRAAEMQGALAAQAGALGVGGSSVELLEKTTELQKEMEQSQFDEETKRYSFRQSGANANILDKAINSIDSSQYFANLDHTIDVSPKPLKNRWGAVIGVAVATYFGGPEAGKAAADTTLGSWNASNGQYTQASQYFSSAAQGAMQGFQNWQNAKKAGYNSWWAQVTAPQPNNSGGDTKVSFGGEAPSWFKSSQSSETKNSGSSWGWGWGG